MGQDNPLLLLVMLAASLVVVRWWWADFQANRRGAPPAHPLPGATPATRLAVGLAAAVALLLLGAETWGEYRLGLVTQQTRLTLLFGVYTLAAAFVEELIFRGFIVVENRGTAALWAGVVGASVLFALLHPYLWEWRDGHLRLQIESNKAWFSTTAIFAGSLWFYTVRFWSLNPTRSLWPCIAAHLAKNLGVLLIKYCQGFVSGAW
jgi:hypothetical protein